MSLDHLITTLNALPTTLIAGVELFTCLLFMLSALRGFGIHGLYCFITVALLAANIEVLKGGQFIFPSHPIAMGTLLFGTIALALDIITEFYGQRAALRGVYLGFSALCLFTWLMLLTVGIKPLNPQQLTPDVAFLYENHLHIKALFMPLPGILAASLIAYLLSQTLDVLIFRTLRQRMHARWLGLRTVIATAVSAFIDTCVFSLLAWKLFNPTPVSLVTLITLYIFGTYPLRLMCSIGLSPFIYLARYFLPNVQHANLSKL